MQKTRVKGKPTRSTKPASVAVKYYHTLHAWYLQHRTLAMTILFVTITAICSFIFYKRFPDNYHYANFFAEDGQHFVQNILDDGFLHAVFTTFNGYFIWGIYFLTGIGFTLNQLLSGGHFINLPEALAITSYIFLGFCCALPLLLLRSYLRLPYLIAAALLLAMLPMPSFDYITIGTIGNLKFAFFFISFLLLLYRIKLSRNSRKVFLVDAGLLVCCYTIAEAYVILPFLLLCDGIRPGQLLKRTAWRSTFTRSNASLLSFVALGLLAFVQVVMVAINGTPELPGYLDEPYQFGKTIEIFIGRMFFFPFLSAIYSHLNDVLVVTATIIGAGLILKFGNRSNRPIYILGVISILAATAVLIFNRTGVSTHYDHYQLSGFDNFFYPQNFIAIILGILLLTDINKRVDWFNRFRLSWVIVLLAGLGMLYVNLTTAPNNFMPYQIGTLKQQAQKICPTDQKNVRITVYPFDFLYMYMPHQRLCDPSVNLRTGIESFGTTSVANDPLNIFPGQSAFVQTFVPHQDNLKGLVVYLSTYSQTTLHGYHLRLFRADCTSELRVAPLPSRVRDNAYSVIEFAPLADSADKEFCFAITPDNGSSPQLAVQFSRETSYSQGTLQLNGAPYLKDVVFQAIYK
jgi:hypothetical protein